MALTKKHFVAVAAVIREEVSRWDDGGLDATSEERDAVGYAIHHIALGLADIFKAENPMFDRVRFLKACVGS